MQSSFHVIITNLVLLTVDNQIMEILRTDFRIEFNSKLY